jgi:hypothetical protein
MVSALAKRRKPTLHNDPIGLEPMVKQPMRRPKRRRSGLFHHRDEPEGVRK